MKWIKFSPHPCFDRIGIDKKTRGSGLGSAAEAAKPGEGVIKVISRDMSPV
jgi:hypothetical protein